jgi:hypothetical protein
MTVKFRVGFTLTGETLFGMIAKMLPIENLSVEELAPPRAPQVTHSLAPPKPPKPPKSSRKRHSPGPDLKKGINRIIVEIMEDGEPHRAADMQRAIAAGGYSKDSVGSRLEALRAQGIVDHLDDGRWRLVK